MRDLPDAHANQAFLPGNRRGVRRPRPHDDHAFGQEDRRRDPFRRGNRKQHKPHDQGDPAGVIFHRKQQSFPFLSTAKEKNGKAVENRKSVPKLFHTKYPDLTPTFSIFQQSAFP